MRLFRKRNKRPVFPRPFTSDDLGIGPRNDGRGNFRCDICKNLRPPRDITISPGDGFVECRFCSPDMFKDALDEWNEKELQASYWTEPLDSLK
jgi:hypothetical protein